MSSTPWIATVACNRRENRREETRNGQSYGRTEEACGGLGRRRVVRMWSGEITATRAALETSLSVAEADEMLSGLAENGHVRVQAREVSLAYSLWDMDRREEIGGNDA